MANTGTSQDTLGATAVSDWMVNYISSVIDMPKESFPVNERFDNYGLDSVEITIMCGMMEEQYEIEVSPGEVFNNPSVAALSAHIAQRISERSATV